MHFPTIDFRGQLTDLMSLERSTGTPWEHPWEAACPTSPQPWRSLAWPYDGHALSGACWNRNLTMDTSWGWCRTPGDHQLGFAIFSPMIYRVKCTIPTVVFSPDFWTINSTVLSGGGGFECCCFNFIPNKFGKDYKHLYLTSVHMGSQPPKRGGLFWCLKNQFWKSRTKLIGWETPAPSAEEGMIWVFP